MKVNAKKRYRKKDTWGGRTRIIKISGKNFHLVATTTKKSELPKIKEFQKKRGYNYFRVKKSGKYYKVYGRKTK